MQKNKRKFIIFSLSAGALFLLAASLFYFHAFRSAGERPPRAKPGLADERLQSLLQEEAKAALSEYITLKRPDIRRITFHRIQTESFAPDKVKIVFSYTLSTDKRETAGDFSATASAWLVKDKPSAEGGLSDNQWTLSGFQVEESLMDFSEPLLVKASPPSAPGGGASSEEAAPPSGGQGDLIKKAAPKLKPSPAAGEEDRGRKGR